MERARNWKPNGVNKRTGSYVPEIDIAKAIGIVLVILGHLEALSGPVWKQFAASFHMPLFFFIYGIVGMPSESTAQGALSFIKKKLIRIMIPYFLWSLIYSWNALSVKQLLCIVYGNNKTFADAGLWFCPTMFVAECISYWVSMMKKRFGQWVIYACGLLCGILGFLMTEIGRHTLLSKYGFPFSFDIALTAVVFVLAGNVWKTFYLDKIVHSPRRGKEHIYIVVLVLFLLVFILSRVNSYFIVDKAYTRVVMARASYGLYPLFILSGVLGSMATLLLSAVVKPFWLLDYIGKNSLLYMCTNHICIATFMFLLGKVISVDALSTSERFGICMIALCIVLALCTALSVGIKRWVPILNGKMEVERK